MCRHLAYLGSPRTLGSLLLEPEHSLEVQSYAPKEMRGALLNADGFGIAWHSDDRFARYRSTLPLWGDENLRDIAHLRSSCVVANARSATPGMGMGILNTPPFLHRGWVFSHNGYVRGFRESTMRKLRAELGDDAYASIRGSTDSEHLFALFLDALDDDPIAAMKHTVARIRQLAPDAEILLSLIASDGEQIIACTHAFNGEAPTLYLHASEDTWIASEPTFEGAWEPITGVRVHAGGVERFAL